MNERLVAQGLTLDDLKREMLIKFEREGYPEPYCVEIKYVGRPTPWKCICSIGVGILRSTTLTTLHRSMA